MDWYQTFLLWAGLMCVAVPLVLWAASSRE